MKIHQIVKFNHPVDCSRDDVEEVTCCEHSSAKKKKEMPCRMCLGTNRRDNNIADEYPVDEYGRRIKVTRPEDWKGAE